MAVFPTSKDPPLREMVQDHLKALERKPFDHKVAETGVTHTVEEVEARRQERLKRGER